MTITLAGSPSTVVTSGSGTTGAMDSTVGPADLLLEFISGPSDPYTQGKDSATNTWTDGTIYANNTSAHYVRIPHKLNPTTNAAQTFTSQSSVFYQGIIAAAFKGVGAFQTQSGASETGPATSHPASSGAMTPSANGALIVSMLAVDPASSPGTITLPSGFTELARIDAGGSNWPMVVAYEIQTTATPRTPTWTTANSVRSCATTKIFLPPVAPPVITGPSGAAGAGSSTANIAENATTGPTFTTDITLGSGYPALTGAQAANWTITALSSTSWRIDPVTPFDFEVGGLVNPQAFTFNASASVSQSCAVTVTNVNEAPTFSGTVSVPTLTQGSPMTPVNAGALFSDPDSGDTAAYSTVGVWPAGVTVDNSTGDISGTPSAAATYANLRVRRTDSGSLTADSNLFTITVAASGGVTFSGTVPAQSGTVGAAFSLALASYFSGTGTYAVQSGALPTGLSLDSSTGAITGTPTTAGTYSGVVIRKTAASGSPATADTNAFAFTIAAAPVVYGFKLSTAAGLQFGNIVGTLTGLGLRPAGEQYVATVHSAADHSTIVVQSGALAMLSGGRLPDFSNASIANATIYFVSFRRVSDGATCSALLTSEAVP